MKLLVRIATHHACDLVEDQYKASTKVDFNCWLDHLKVLERRARENLPLSRSQDSRSVEMLGQREDSNLDDHRLDETLPQVLNFPPEALSVRLIWVAATPIPVPSHAPSKTQECYPLYLVRKCMRAIKNLIIRAEADKTPVTNADIAVAILNVGTFRATDIQIMSDWHKSSKLVAKTRSLISWVKSVEPDNPDEVEERAQILKDIALWAREALSIQAGNVSDLQKSLDLVTKVG
ncbi:hypothetical protein F444_02888 [Phytophthora nicotianae P1976]|uniref:Uncharacterized protein n=1 Tax=Phytophthora nicotianae P1976 TaxID=1317066 RepID=A0A081AVV5_PHYNI|nr:hypothetical protein F444_02888 [Phytophthora nicotianae P1976]